MHDIELVLGLLSVLLILMTVARRVSIPYPITLVVGGLALGLIPGLPVVHLEPELILFLFLPPLLFSEANATSWRDFKANLRPISLLAVGLVLATTGVVAVLTHALLPELPWAVAFVFGAVVAPTDAVAALAIAHRLPVPRRIVTVLVGESLVNDATALVAFRMAIVATLTGAFVWYEALQRFAVAGAGGILIGMAVAWGLLWLRRLFQDDSTLDNTALLLVPFMAYLAAETVGASGVLAVVTCGLYLGRRNARLLSSETRMQARGLWEMLDFLFNGLLFVLVGLQLRAILHTELAHPLPTLVWHGVLVTLAVILTRLAWVFPSTYLPRWLVPGLAARDPSPPVGHVLVLGWTGMRGGISLAAALAIPATLANGAPFPGRDEIVLMTFVVILGTLIFQGLSLPFLIRATGLERDEGHEREETAARMEAVDAALLKLDELAARGDVPEDILAAFRRMYDERLHRICARVGLEPDAELEHREESAVRTRREIVEAERRAVVALRDRGVIGDDVLHHLLQELDLEELWLSDVHARGAHG
jgi:CPA1 family monovalent cation:H+ antiporter